MTAATFVRSTRVACAAPSPRTATVGDVPVRVRREGLWSGAAVAASAACAARDACAASGALTPLVDWAAWPETHDGDCCPAEEATETAPADFLECCAAAELPRFSFYDEAARPNTTAAVPSYADDDGGSVAVLRDGLTSGS